MVEWGLELNLDLCGVLPLERSAVLESQDLLVLIEGVDEFFAQVACKLGLIEHDFDAEVELAFLDDVVHGATHMVQFDGESDYLEYLNIEADARSSLLAQ